MRPASHLKVSVLPFLFFLRSAARLRAARKGRQDRSCSHSFVGARVKGLAWPGWNTFDSSPRQELLELAEGKLQTLVKHSLFNGLRQPALQVAR